MAHLFIGFPVARAKIADMISGSAPPSTHHTQHEHGGADEIDATGLEGAAGLTLPWDDLFCQLLFESIDGFYTYATGSGAISVDSYAIKLITGATADSLAISSKKMIRSTPPWNWSKNSTLISTVAWKFFTSSTGVFWLRAGDEGYYKGYGFKALDGKVYGSVGNDSSETVIDLSDDFIANAFIYKRLKAIHTAGSKVEFYIDGILKGEISTGLPSGAPGVAPLFSARIENPAVAQDKLLQVSQFIIHQEA